MNQSFAESWIPLWEFQKSNPDFIEEPIPSGVFKTGRPRYSITSTDNVRHYVMKLVSKNDNEYFMVYRRPVPV